jgi:hypothetical protein
VKECKPKSCTCPDDDEEGSTVPITLFGCAQGGMPECGDKGELVCENNETTIGLMSVFRAQMRDECVCGADARAPLCQADSSQPLCPDGSGNRSVSLRLSSSCHIAPFFRARPRQRGRCQILEKLRLIEKILVQSIITVRTNSLPIHLFITFGEI